MNLVISLSDASTLDPLRQRFLQENDFQFVHNKCHRYGWADIYAFAIHDATIGYGAVWGLQQHDCFFEFYLLPEWRPQRAAIFSAFQQQVGFTKLECQTNDRFTSEMVFLTGSHLEPEAVLFRDAATTKIILPQATLETTSTETDHHYQYAVKVGDDVVATGGMLLNYNFPYADIYYETAEPFRRQGYGAWLAQELKKEAYRLGRVPAARCNVNNLASRGLLLKAGFEVCGFLVNGNMR